MKKYILLAFAIINCCPMSAMERKQPLKRKFDDKKTAQNRDTKKRKTEPTVIPDTQWTKWNNQYSANDYNLIEKKVKRNNAARYQVSNKEAKKFARDLFAQDAAQENQKNREEFIAHLKNFQTVSALNLIKRIPDYKPAILLAKIYSNKPDSNDDPFLHFREELAINDLPNEMSKMAFRIALIHIHQHHINKMNSSNTQQALTREDLLDEINYQKINIKKGYNPADITLVNFYNTIPGWVGLNHFDPNKKKQRRQSTTPMKSRNNPTMLPANRSVALVDAINEGNTDLARHHAQRIDAYGPAIILSRIASNPNQKENILKQYQLPQHINPERFESFATTMIEYPTGQRSEK